MMSTGEVDMKVRPVTLEDLDAILAIDRRIRRAGKAVTYANLTTERIFSIDRKVTRRSSATSYLDLITGDVSELLELGLVAEVEGRVRAFILGGIEHVGKAGSQVGVIRILGVHPDFWRRGIAAHLVNSICEKYRSKGVRRVHVRIDQRDKDLLGFFEHMSFQAGHLIDFTKTL